MPRKCKGCTARARQEIDLALASGTALSALSRQYHISEDSLWRHKAHISKAIIRSAERAGEKLEDTLRTELDKIREGMWTLQQQMQKEGDLRGALVALKELRGVVDSMASILMPPKARRDADSHDRYFLIVQRLNKSLGKAKQLPARVEAPADVTVEPIPPSS